MIEALILFAGVLLATIIGVGWKLNYDATTQNNEDIQHLSEDVKELRVWLTGSDTYNNGGEMGSHAELIDEIHRDIRDLSESVDDLVEILDELNNIEDFDQSKFD